MKVKPAKNRTIEEARKYIFEGFDSSGYVSMNTILNSGNLVLESYGDDSIAEQSLVVT
jgi:uncharacterized protein (DUF1697 family)